MHSDSFGPPSGALAATSPLVVGIDAGGTRTRVVIAEAEGRELARAEGPGSAIVPGDEAASAESMRAVVAEALVNADRADTRPAMCVVGVAGGGQPRAAATLRAALLDWNVADDVTVTSDAMVALDDAFGDSAGILLISGTGSVAFARAPDGRIERCGGWGPRIGDEGSAAWLGARTLSVISAAHDGREPETALVGTVLTALELDSMEALVQWAAAVPRAELAALAPIVAATALTGDIRANALISICVEELVLHVRTLARRCFVDERAAVNVAMSGGLLSRGSLVRKRLEQRLKSAVPGSSIRAEDIDAANGAVRRARKLLGVEV